MTSSIQIKKELGEKRGEEWFVYLANQISHISTLYPESDSLMTVSLFLVHSMYNVDSVKNVNKQLRKNKSPNIFQKKTGVFPRL